MEVKHEAAMAAATRANATAAGTDATTAGADAEATGATPPSADGRGLDGAAESPGRAEAAGCTAP